MQNAIVKIRPLLQSTDFGDDVAEFDQHLSTYFVETSSVLEIFGDRADLILGEKGSGKSAIFRQMSNPEIGIPAIANVDILPAFNVQGSVIFRRLSRFGPLPIEAYRFIWFTFIVGMIANHIVDSYGSVMDVSELKRLLYSANLQVQQPFAPRLWERIEKLIQSISRRLEVEGELEFATPILPIKSRAKARMHPTSDGPQQGQEVNLEQVLSLCDGIFAQMERRCWLLFDRLDEAFEHDRRLEGFALHGLLRAHLDVASFGFRLRAKLFLRNDVMERVTRTRGFVNASHLRRLHLEWDEESIIDLIARRIASSEAIADFFQIETESLRSRETRMKICNYVLPKTINGAGLTTWLSDNTTDANASLNPRNTISLLRLARQHQLNVYDRDDPPYRADIPLITEDIMERGLVELSNARLQDTVLAEFRSLRPFIESLAGHSSSAQLSRAKVAELAGISPRSSQYRDLLNDLSDSGVVARVTDSGKIVISRLYRPALNLYNRKVRIDRTEQADLRELVDEAVHLSPNSEVVLPGATAAERHFIYTYIRESYPGYDVTSVETGEPGIKQVVLQPKSLL